MQLPNPEALLSDITAQIKAQLQPTSALVGIHSGGVWLMQRILKSVGDIAHGNILHGTILNGTLDAALYRDDFAQRGLKTAPKPSNIPFDVAGKHIILIDDIFYTGRTVRAAMNELFDFGRPASITLAVLISRGGAQLPIRPQIVGADIALTPSQNLQLSQNTQGLLSLTLEENN